MAKVTRLDILQDIYQALKTTLVEGKTGQWFAKELTPALQVKEWWVQTRIPPTPVSDGELRSRYNYGARSTIPMADAVAALPFLRVTLRTAGSR